VRNISTCDGDGFRGGVLWGHRTLAAAIELNEAWGWWGGMKPKHRAKLRSRTMTAVEWRIGRPEVRPVNTAGTAA
jgi:hypothetical protein